MSCPGVESDSYSARQRLWNFFHIETTIEKGETAISVLEHGKDTA